MVLDLEGRWADCGVAEEIEDERALEVGDTDGFREAFLGDRLHGCPGLLDAGVAELHVVLSVVSPSGWVAHGGVDVFKRDGEVHDVEVEVLEAPIGELLARDGLDLWAVVEGVPELGDDEEIFTLYQAVLDGAGDALAGLFLVAVVCSC